MLSKKHALLCGLSLLACALGAAANAQTAYPNRPVTLVATGAPGGLADSLGRLVAKQLGGRLGQPVVVDNKTGAGGNIAAEHVARAPADGYTLLLGSQGTQAANQFLYKSIKFDPASDFVSVHALLSIPNVLVTRPGLDVASVSELVALAQGKSTRLTASSAGYGTGTHLVLELFKSQAKVDIQHIPYKGSVPGLMDVMANRVDMTFDYASATANHIKAGKLKALAVTDTQRLAILPDIPSMAEAGYPSIISSSWIGVFAPSRTPPSIVEKLRAEISAIVKTPEFNKAMEQLGGKPLNLNGAEFEGFVSEERLKWKTIIERTGVLIE